MTLRISTAITLDPPSGMIQKSLTADAPPIPTHPPLPWESKACLVRQGFEARDAPGSPGSGGGGEVFGEGRPGTGMIRKRSSREFFQYHLDALTVPEEDRRAAHATIECSNPGRDPPDPSLVVSSPRELHSRLMMGREPLPNVQLPLSGEAGV